MASALQLHRLSNARAHCSSNAKGSGLGCGAQLASELAAQRHNILLGARQLPFQHVHTHAGIRLYMPESPLSQEYRLLGATLRAF